MHRTYQTLDDERVADMAIAMRVGFNAKDFEGALDMIRNRHTDQEPGYSIPVSMIENMPPPEMSEDPREWESI